MRNYELTVLFHPDLEMNPDPAIEKVKGVIDQAGGAITKEENEGKKRLSYPINGHTFALYYYADVTLPSDAPNKISSVFNISDEIIRFLLVRTDVRRAKLATESAETQSEADTEETEDAKDAESTEEATNETNDKEEE